MITDAVVSAFVAAVSALITLAPTVTLPTDAGTQNVASIVHTADNIVPVVTIVACLAAIMAARIGLQLWNFGLWAFHQIHGSD